MKEKINAILEEWVEKTKKKIEIDPEQYITIVIVSSSGIHYNYINLGIWVCGKMLSTKKLTIV